MSCLIVRHENFLFWPQCHVTFERKAALCSVVERCCMNQRRAASGEAYHSVDEYTEALTRLRVENAPPRQVQLSTLRAQLAERAWQLRTQVASLQAAVYASNTAKADAPCNVFS